MKSAYVRWLEAQSYGSGTVSAQLYRAQRVEEFYGNLDAHYAKDKLVAVIQALQYSVGDERAGRSNPSKIPFSGNPRTNLASYRNAIENYRRYLAGEKDAEPAAALDVRDTADPQVDANEAVQRIGLEKDMQAALRRGIDQLEAGLTISDGGVERIVESGRIDITGRGIDGATVVVELKAGDAGQRAVAQILSYMGDVQIEEPDAVVRGLLVASSFDRKAIAAARMAPALTLKTYGVRFVFSDAEI